MKMYGPTFDAMSDVSSGPDAQGDANVTMDAGDGGVGCPGITALLAGSSSSLVGASRVGDAALKVDVLSGGTNDRMAIVALGAGFLGVLRSPNDAIRATVFSTSWADPVVVASAVTRDAPALAAIQMSAHLVYQAKSNDQNVDFKFFHGTFSGGMWDSANDPVGGSGPSQSYGPRAPTMSALGAQLRIVQGGDDSVLYDQVWSGSWQAAMGHGMLQKTIPPVIVALNGGADDALVVFARNGDYKIMSTSHSGSGWSTPVLVDANAFLSGATNEPVALAALPNGKAVLVFRGTDSKPYVSFYDPMAMPPWTAPGALVSGTNPDVSSLPSIAPGVCGADIVVAFVESGMGVKLTKLTGTTWSAPELVPQSSAAAYVAVATHP
jgi:hypothetical protein